MRQHSFVTALSPIEYQAHDPDNRISSIRQTLIDHEQVNSPFADCPMVHMSRLQIIDHLPPPMGDVSGVKLKTKYLLFAVNIDGRIEDFLDCLYRTNTQFVHDVWGRCIGYPAYKGAVFFRRYIRQCFYGGSLGYAGFPAGVDEILLALAQKTEIAEWIATHQGMDDAELNAAWRRDRARYANLRPPKPGSF
ncbi:MAG: hypothetical protein JJ850_11950 [Kordiimonadaceae bacterium]|nr:hypothetical protein [Kordiimonadaceae bacterium]MBO6568698.1 hypothetical protein [Kordiimonadaceae bacterium]MBO6965326.1 hypothetical protein [Kordiimonadaceae bacterium]